MNCEAVGALSFRASGLVHVDQVGAVVMHHEVVLVADLLTLVDAFTARWALTGVSSGESHGQSPFASPLTRHAVILPKLFGQRYGLNT